LSYIRKNLNPGERILYETHLHWIVLLGAIVVDVLISAGGIALLVWAATGKQSDPGEAQVIGIAGAVLLVIGNLILAVAFIRRNATEMAVTSKRIIVKVGFLTKRTIELFLSKVESIDVAQTLGGRIMGYGSITVRGIGGTYEPFSPIANPLEFRRQVQNQIEESTSTGSR
jgi:uncharacterized membrane protein YdbT with pleckstrin-like domain